MKARLRRLLRPVRRKAAVFALVGEERITRVAETHALVDPVVARLQALEHGQREVQATLEVLSDRVHSILLRSDRNEEVVVARAEAVISEVMHRAEASDARLATDLQKALEVLGRQQREVAALTSAVAVPTPLGPLTVREGMKRSPHRLLGELERGTREQVAALVAPYLPLFEGADPVVDLGCGRGEFLELAAEAGLSAYGVDSDADSVAACRALGLKVEQEDLLEHLARLENDSVGGLMCTHVVEHLEPASLWPFLAEVHRVLRPGGTAVLETPNPSTLATHLGSFWRDPTHVRPVPAPALWFAVRQAGLIVLDTWYGHRPEEQLAASGLHHAADPTVRALARQHDAVVGRLNELLLGPQDYAVIVRKP